MSLIAYNSATKKFQYSSAKRKVFIESKNEIQVLSGNNYPIGGWQIEKNRKYNTLEFEMETPFCVYLFSDGFQDQFGGPAFKRFGFKKLQEMIKSMCGKTLTEKEQHVKTTFENWAGNGEQTDDICLLAIEFN